jgi:hypothetical protein
VFLAVLATMIIGAAPAAAKTTPPPTVLATTLPVPGADLFGVSCPSTKLCFAVGAIQMIGDSGPQSTGLIERFDGHRWSESRRLHDTVSQLNAVSCTSTSFCLAVGYDGAFPAPTVALRWNGHTWSKAPSASPVSAGEGDDLLGVDCLTQRDCWAVGGLNINDIPIPPRSLIEHFDGSSLQTVANPDAKDALDSIGCRSAMSCYATADRSPLEQLEGSTWQIVTQPGAFDGNGEAITCRTSSTCWIFAPTLTHPHLGAFHLAGGAFRTAPFVATSFEPIPRGGDCATATDCWLVGGSQVGSPMPAFAPLAEHWDGSRWVPARTRSNYDGDAEFTAVSCTPSGQCVAVGRSLLTAQMMALTAVITPSR